MPQRSHPARKGCHFCQRRLLVEEAQLASPISSFQYVKKTAASMRSRISAARFGSS